MLESEEASRVSMNEIAAFCEVTKSSQQGQLESITESKQYRLTSDER